MSILNKIMIQEGLMPPAQVAKLRERLARITKHVQDVGGPSNLSMAERLAYKQIERLQEKYGKNLENLPSAEGIKLAIQAAKDSGRVGVVNVGLTEPIRRRRKK